MTVPDWLCSPHTCYTAGWLYDYQTLIAGVVAGIAAFLTVRQIREQIRQSDLTTRRQIEADRDNTERQVGAQQELGPTNALPAKRIAIERGRTPEECLLRVFLGAKMELAFVIPLDGVTPEFAALTQLLDPESGRRAN